MSFQPDWCVHPGETLAEVVEESGLSPKVFAHGVERFGGDEQEVLRVIECKRLYTDETAEAIARFIGGSPVLWKNLRDNYKAALKRGAKDASRG